MLKGLNKKESLNLDVRLHGLVYGRTEVDKKNSSIEGWRSTSYMISPE